MGGNPPFKETPRYKGNWKIRAMHEDFFRWCHRMTPEKGRPDLTRKSALKKGLVSNQFDWIYRNRRGKKPMPHVPKEIAGLIEGLKRDHVVLYKIIYVEIPLIWKSPRYQPGSHRGTLAPLTSLLGGSSQDWKVVNNYGL